MHSSMNVSEQLRDMVKQGGGDAIKLSVDFIAERFLQKEKSTRIKNYFSGKKRQLEDRDFDMVREDVLNGKGNDDVSQIRASEIVKRMKFNAGYATGKFGPSADGFYLDITKKARNIGVYGINKIKDSKPKSMLDFPSTKRLLDLKIEEVSQSVYRGLDIIDKEKDCVIPININASSGFCSSLDPKYNNVFGMVDKSLELDEWFKNDDYANIYKQQPIKTGGSRRMNYPHQKRAKRVAFHLNAKNKLVEGFQTNDNNAYSIRGISMISALSNKNMMLMSKAFQLGKTSEVKSRCEFKREELGAALSASKKFFICTDVSSADYSVSEEQKYYVSSKLCDGMFHKDWEHLQYHSPTVGVSNDENRKFYYYAQRTKNGDRTSSGTGRTFTDNYINFSVNQELNLINLRLVKAGLPDLYKGDYSKEELQAFKDVLVYFNYGDDGVEGLDSEKDLDLFKKILSHNPIVNCDIDYQNTFVGGIIYGTPGNYLFTARLETLLSKTWEGYEGNGPNHPNRSLFFNGMVGKYDYMMNSPYKGDKVMTEQCFDLICDTIGISNDIEWLREKAKLEIEIVSLTQTKLVILDNLVKMLKLKSINDLYHVVTAEEIRATKMAGLDEVFLFVDAKKWKDRTMDIISKEVQWRDKFEAANGNIAEEYIREIA